MVFQIHKMSSEQVPLAETIIEITPDVQTTTTDVQITPDPSSVVEDTGSTNPAFKAYPMMKSYADYLVVYVNTLKLKLSVHTLKKQKSTMMTQFSLPGRSENISDIYYAGRNTDGTMIVPTRENGGFPIVLLVQGPRGKFTKMTSLSIANDLLKVENSTFFLTTSRGRIYLNWA